MIRYNEALIATILYWSSCAYVVQSVDSVRYDAVDMKNGPKGNHCRERRQSPLKLVQEPEAVCSSMWRLALDHKS